jgi:hypothetical protein
MKVLTHDMFEEGITAELPILEHHEVLHGESTLEHVVLLPLVREASDEWFHHTEQLPRQTLGEYPHRSESNHGRTGLVIPLGGTTYDALPPELLCVDELLVQDLFKSYHF